MTAMILALVTISSTNPLKLNNLVTGIQGNMNK